MNAQANCPMKVSCDCCEAVVINGKPCHEARCPGHFTFTPKRKGAKPLAKWRVWSLDVWGNQQDGFEINDRRENGSFYVPIDASDV